MPDGVGDTTEDGDEVGVGVALAVGLAFWDGCGELGVGLGLVGVTVGEVVGAPVPEVVVVEELFVTGVGLTPR